MEQPTPTELMRRALRVARDARTPYGAVICHRGRGETVEAANSVRQDRDPTAHAEINAIRAAAARGWSGHDLWLVSTCEPCPMCAMAAVWAGIPRIYFGAGIDDAARFGHQVGIYCRELAAQAWYDVLVEGGLLREECVNLFELKT